MIRLGLCCTFRDQPVKFTNTTATAMAKLPRGESLVRLGRACLANARALRSALEYCAAHEIGCFRINSQILPLKTHPTLGYLLEELPDHAEIRREFLACGRFAFEQRLRTCFHPDQFVVLNSTRTEVVEASIKELEYQSEVAEWVGADVVNVHGGGSYGDKPSALVAFARNLDRVSDRVRRRLTVENDDRVFTPADLEKLCKSSGIPLVYDVHHHRCLKDHLSVEEATEMAVSTWTREPLFHLSSPREGWNGPKPARHHDFIDIADLPPCWRDQTLTVEVEAKAKEVAVLKLKSELIATG